MTDEENDKQARLKKIQKVSFEDGRLVPARSIKERARQYQEGKIKDKPRPPKQRGRPKGKPSKCKKCGQEGHIAKTCKQKDEEDFGEVKVGGLAVDYIKGRDGEKK